ncbi:Uncharacterized protein dnm_006870 [Desulfonema magnum]|uniref:Uncharacterized protein n=1 Tax=Desulfonema magnum TaxID=45655 RepID=A0A975GLD0_9BACT|nr:Uncharacterized protein dnm_006870 [Desulfonema magnum]
MQLRKSIFRTPDRPPGKSGVQKFYFSNCEKVFFALRR